MGLVARHPPLTLTVVVLVVAAPAIFLTRRRGNERLVRSYVLSLLAVAGLWAVVHSIAYLVRLRPAVEGVDFYNYLCVARDLRAGLTTLSTARYVYFPGVYAFWRFALLVGNGTLAGAQWTYITLLAANAVALALIVWRTVRSWIGAVTCAVGYVTLCARLEGGFGIAEPIATLPVATALVIWAGAPLRGRRGLIVAAALGIGIGIGAWVKQQGALQAVGWLALPLTNRLASSERRHDWRAIGMVPLAAAGAFMLAILAEGHGLLPLRVGIKAVGNFEAEWTLWANLTEIAHVLAPLMYASAVALVATSIGVVRWPQMRSQPWFGLALFAVLATMGGIYQFTRRGYYHYGLLCAPWLLVAVILCIVGLARARLAERSRSPTVAFAALLACALPFVRTEHPLSEAFFLWPPAAAETPDFGHWRKQPPVADDLTKLGAFVHPGEDMLLLPPRHDDIYFLTGARSQSWAQGYGWGFERTPAISALSSPTLKVVIVLNVRDPTDAWTWGWHYCQDALKALPKAGFHQTASLMTMTVWRRP